jgi:hypothetical protein
MDCVGRGSMRPKDLGILDGSVDGLILPRRVKAAFAVPVSALAESASWMVGGAEAVYQPQCS